MLARILALVIVVASLALIAPPEASPVETVSAYCWAIDGVDDCFNPCAVVAAPYNTLRRETGTDDKTPDAHCPA